MNKINEVQVLTNVSLSQAQKFILSKLMLPNSTPLMSYEQVSAGSNVVANRDVLIKLGMVEIGENEASITDLGKDALKNVALIDDTGNLTPEGEQYAYAEKLEDIAKFATQGEQPPAPETDATANPPPPDGMSPGAGIAQQSDSEAKPSFESWQMVTDIQEKLNHKKFMDSYSKKS